MSSFHQKCVHDLWTWRRPVNVPFPLINAASWKVFLPLFSSDQLGSFMVRESSWPWYFIDTKVSLLISTYPGVIPNRCLVNRNTIHPIVVFFYIIIIMHFHRYSLPMPDPTGDMQINICGKLRPFDPKHNGEKIQLTLWNCLRLIDFFLIFAIQVLFMFI